VHASEQYDITKTFIILPVGAGEQSIVLSVSVCLSVHSHISEKTHLHHLSCAPSSAEQKIFVMSVHVLARQDHQNRQVMAGHISARQYVNG